jgi:multimeric flavodoxin WrbA
VIAYYSRTGNTQAMATILEEEAKLRGHVVRMVQIQHDRKPGYFGCLNIASGKKPAEISNAEADLDLASADVVLLGAPVWAGRFSPYMRTFLDRVSSVKDKTAGVFVSCSSEQHRATTYAPVLAECAVSRGLDVKARLCASRKDRAQHREMARAFLDELLPG